MTKVDLSNIVSTIELACGHVGTFPGRLGKLSAGIVWPCAEHGEQVIVRVQSELRSRDPLP